MKEINIGLIGFGYSAKTIHFPIIQSVEGYNIKAIVTGDPSKITDEYAGISIYKSFELLLEDKTIDTVVIATPNSTHFDIAKKALRSGKSVIVEKPFVTTYEEGLELIKLAEKENLLLTVFQNRRWDSDFLTVKKIIKEGLLGDVHTYEAHFSKYKPEISNKWKENNEKGSGVLYDLAPHIIDQAITIFGNPETVFADVQSQRDDAKTNDYYHIILGYGKKRIILHTGSIVLSDGPRFQIHGTKGSFIKYGIDPQESQLKQGQNPLSIGWGEETIVTYGDLITNYEKIKKEKIKSEKGCYQNFYIDFYQSFINKKPLSVKPYEALNSIKIIELALESSEFGKTLRFR